MLGLNDPRVPAGESEQIVQAVRKHGVDVWYILAKDEGHGFSKKKNIVSREKWFLLILKGWIDKYWNVVFEETSFVNIFK